MENYENLMNGARDKAREMGKKASNKAQDITDTVSDKAQQAGEMIKESSQEWVNYIKAHPFQITILTGMAAFLVGRMMK